MRISLVIPVRDDAVALRECLETVAAQTRRPDELIVVDNASSDATAQTAIDYGALVVFEPRVGIWPAAARGYDAATGSVIARCDADSRLPCDWLERIESHMRQDPDVVAVTGPGVFYGLGPIARALASVLYVRAYFWSVHAALASRALFGSNLALRASTWQRVRSRVHRDDAEVHDDMDLSFALDVCDRVVHDPGLRVGISPRPLRGRRQFVRRLRRAGRTLAVNWPEQSPWKRWGRRIRHSRMRGANVG